MRSRGRIYLEDAEGGSWDDDCTFEGDTDEAIDEAAIELAQSWFQCEPQHTSAVKARIELDDRTIEIEGDDVTVW